MIFIPIKTPYVIKKMFPNFIWDIVTYEKTIYLTFDDGPTAEITNWILNTLDTFQAKATFFCIGNNIEKHPETFQNILKNGHAIGNHTQNHVKGWKTKTLDYLAEVEQAEQNIEKQSFQLFNAPKKTAKLFRPPYGKIKSTQSKSLIKQGYKIIMWDVLSFDWDRNISTTKCLENVISKAKNGSIIVFHDSEKASKNMQSALPKVLKHFSEQGYVFKSISL